MAAKRFDPQAKAKRQKKIAIGGFVVLAVLLVIQVPRTMKTLNQQSAAPAETEQVETPQGEAPAGRPARGAIQLVDTDRSPAPGDGQLVSFGLFERKDPFIQQVPLGDTASEEQADAGTEPEATPEFELPTVVPPTTPTAPSAGEQAAPTKATISINGVNEVVSVGGQFPAADPIFRLVSLTAEKAEIGIVGGGYDSGAATSTLTKDQPLILVNTADGSRYELRLVAVAQA